MGYSYPWKLIPWKFNPQYIVTTKICMFTVRLLQRAYIFLAHFISDVDECSSVNNCQQDCQNLPGFYNCSCFEGFKLGPDGKSCNGWLLLCTTIIYSWYYWCSGTYLQNSLPIALAKCFDSNDCSHICAMVDGTPSCFCNLGYELAVGSDVQCVGMFKHTIMWTYLRCDSCI